MERKRVGLVGVTGYTGMELCRLVLHHPGMELVAATSRAEAGKRLGDLYPHLYGTTMAEVPVQSPDYAALAAACDVVFLAVPHGTAMHAAKELVAAGCRVVDLSADFRLRDVGTYTAWYATDHACPKLVPEAVYGLPELYAEAVAGARLVANPGCYPTASILALYPAVAAGLVEPEDLIIDAKSGASGAGRKANVATLFCEVHDSFRAYNLGRHRHTPEIEQELSRAAGKALTVSFNPHLVPMDRGILATCYGRLRPHVDEARVREVYAAFASGKPWVRFLPPGVLPETRWVRGTNFCDIAVVVDERTRRLIVVSCIDNLCRGASGQALVNANVMLGFPEDAGLSRAPLVP
jgi:N-acetyl-gamma-glutamyl-phosphate reductase